MKKLTSNIERIEKTWDKITPQLYREVIILNFKKEIPLSQIEVRKLNVGIAIYVGKNVRG